MMLLKETKKMKKLAEIPAQLLSKENCTVLKLKEEPYLILIPKSIIQKAGFIQNDLNFDLVKNDQNKLSLLGHESSSHPRVNQTIPLEEIIG